MRNMDSVITGIFLPLFKSPSYTLSTDIPKLDLSAYFISGKYDYTVSQELSKKYFDLLLAPIKGFYTFEQSAHSPVFEEQEKFVNIMLADVLNSTSAMADK